MSHKDRCYVCGNAKLNPIMLTCINCCPYLYEEGHITRRYYTIK